METQALEQMLGSEIVPTIGQERMCGTIDLYVGGTAALYSFNPPKPMDGYGQINRIPSSPINPVVIPYGNETGLGGDVHDTFKIDRYHNPYGGHTSVKI